MKGDKKINEIEKVIEYLREPIGKSVLEHRKAVNLAVQALEKQIPKKPIDTEEAWLCPGCKGHIHHQQQLMHCIQCGQLVNWR